MAKRFCDHLLEFGPALRGAVVVCIKEEQHTSNAAPLLYVALRDIGVVSQLLLSDDPLPFHTDRSRHNESGIETANENWNSVGFPVPFNDRCEYIISGHSGAS
ncbi:MAG: hypothetical protein KF691_01190 [Phycisphaeraceae bacterium]|nr:hypothetical protein [Phycisphaeraceae bacterium]